MGSGYNFAARVADAGFVFDDVSPSGFVYDKNLYLYILGLMNAKVFKEYLSIFGKNMKTEIGHVQTVPYIAPPKMGEEIDDYVKKNVVYSREDWDSFETSWDFKKHPMI